MSSVKDYLHLNFLVVVWSFTAILGVLITIPAVEVVFYRTLFAAISLAAILKFTDGRFAIGRVNIIKMLLTGAVIGAHWVLFFASARVANVSISLIGMATVAFWTSLLEPMVNRKKVSLFEVILGVVIIGGLYIVYQVNLSYKLGLMMALGSAIMAAIFSVINGRLAQKHHHMTITMYEMIGACLAVVLFMPIYTKYFSESGAFQWRLSSNDFIYILILALVCTVYAFSISVELLKRISVFASNLFLHMEPVYGIVLAVLIFGEAEKMDTGFYVGGTIIILAVFSYPVVKFYQKRKKAKL
jgi:drug/metabolite transporter (DMT)-like permease